MAMQTGGSGELNSEINITPFVDVMLVLLIIFMVAAPMMVKAVEVDLPKANAAALDDPAGKLVLSIRADGRLRLGDVPLAWKQLGEKLAGNEKVRRDGTLWVEADRSLPYEYVLTAMAIAKQNGVPKVQLLTEASGAIDFDRLDRGVVPQAVK